MRTRDPVYEYDSFGNPGAIHPLISQPYAFTGREYDPETGLYYYRARYYDPRAGRFITRDPIGFAGGINQYNYVRNNPVRYVDPLGLTKIRIFIETGAMWIDPEQPGRIPYIIPITSGKAESMNRPECSGKENEGPIPKGSYTVDVTQLSNPSKIRDLFNMRYGDWGDWNVPLIPDPETDTYGRRNFLFVWRFIPWILRMC